MKKLINDPTLVVDDVLEGLVLTQPSLALLAGERVVVRADIESFRSTGYVALVSGGGSGHEPAHAGYVGEGMLSAAVCGDVFTSPSTDAVLAAIRAVGGGAGVLLIVKNYTGDRLNFGLAAEIARTEGIPVEMVVVADDVALAANTETAGRRGIAGTVLVHKIAGAAAAAGLPLAEVKGKAERAIISIGSMGVALSSCTVPAAGRPGFSLDNDEIELGLGIHGEAGVSRSKMDTADTLAEILVDRIVAELALASGQRVALLVNNLGSTPDMEMQIIGGCAIKAARRHGLEIDAIWVGSFLTALDMQGCSISLLKLDDDLLVSLNAPTLAPYWPGRAVKPTWTPALVKAATPARERDLATSSGDPRIVVSIRAAAERLIVEESRLTDLDRAVGDGDLGLNLARGAEELLQVIERFRGASAAVLLRALSASVRATVGGTSGALYAAGLLRAAATMDGHPDPTLADWAAALDGAATCIAELGDAHIGDRTMLDALMPAAHALVAASSGSVDIALDKALQAARAGASATARMTPRRGRSSYLQERALGISDPGAEAVVVWLDAIRDALRQSS